MKNSLMLILSLSLFSPVYSYQNAPVSILPASVYALVSACDSAFAAKEFSCRHGKTLILSAQKLDPVVGQNLSALSSANGHISNRHSAEISNWTRSLRQSYQNSRRQISKEFGTKIVYAMPLLQSAFEEFSNGNFSFRKGRELQNALSNVSPDLGMALSDIVDPNGRISNQFKYAIFALHQVLSELSSQTLPPPHNPPGNQKKILTVSEGNFLLHLLRNQEYSEAESLVLRALQNSR